jgi:hypothetical protein
MRRFIAVLLSTVAAAVPASSAFADSPPVQASSCRAWVKTVTRKNADKVFYGKDGSLWITGKQTVSHKVVIYMTLVQDACNFNKPLTNSKHSTLIERHIGRYRMPIAKFEPVTHTVIVLAICEHRPDQ